MQETIHIHDKYQFEIKLGYELAPDRDTTYEVETYLFVPNSLGINRHTYRRHQFYSDIQAYIRFKTPTVLVSGLVDGANNPLDRLREHLRALSTSAGQSNAGRYEFESKMFCCIVKSALRDHVHLVTLRNDQSDIEDLIGKYISGIGALTREFRALRSDANLPTLGENVFSIYLFADEYISLMIETFTYRLLEIAKQKRLSKQQMRRSELLKLITDEIEWRRSHRYPSIPARDSDNEGLIFRKAVLKKYTGSVLFLDTRFKRHGGWLEQGVFAVAAGLSMLFATSVALFSQYTYGTYTLPFLIAMVISYIFKDRMKELTRQYLGGKLRRLLFDHKMTIYAGREAKIGRCRESFDFVSERKIAPRVVKLRNRDHITEIENDWLGEKTIRYRKQITLYGKRLKGLYDGLHLQSINDIMRFDVSRYLAKMDDPQKPIYVCDGEDYQRISGERVYHLNLIIHYATDEKSRYRRFRIILNREGIKKIEEVSVFDERSRDMQKDMPPTTI